VRYRKSKGSRRAKSLRLCGATLQLWWARILESVGLFDRWKKGDSVRTATESRRKKIDKLYDREGDVKEVV
jgi:hypothetical protein